MRDKATERSTSSENATDGERDRNSIQNAWARFCRITSSLHRDDLAHDLEPAIRRMELGLFRLVVMGEVKKGKSSFINALLCEPDLLPTATDVATSTVYKIIYGPSKRAKVFFQPDIDTGKRPPHREISQAEIPDYGTEAGNPGNYKGVDFIGIEVPHALLKGGLALVDTPGVGGLYKAHRDITWRYAPNADAVFFVVDSVESVISADEIKFLQELLNKVTPRVVFVQTKTDMADTEQWHAYQERNKNILTAELGIPPEKLAYFPVSSSLKLDADENQDGEDLIDSGFLSVMRFLHGGLMKAKAQQVAQDVARQLSLAVRRLLGEQHEKLRIRETTGREELERLRQECAEAREQLSSWQQSTYQPEIERFKDRFQDFRDQALRRFQAELDPLGPLVTDPIRELRATEFDPRSVSESASQIQQGILARAAELAGEVQRDFNQTVSSLISETSTQLISDLAQAAPNEILAHQQSALSAEVDEILLHFSRFDDARNAMYGAMAGALMAQVGFGLATFVFPPAAAVAGLAAMLASVAAGSIAMEDLQTRRREEVIRKLQEALQKLLTKCRNQAVSQFNQIATSYERYARDTFRSAADQTHQQLERRAAEINEAAKRSQEESATEVTACRAAIQELQKIRRVLSEAMGKTHG